MFLRRLSALTLVLLACGATTTYAATSLAKPSTLIAEQSTNQKRHDGQKFWNKMVTELNLSSDQQNQMKALRSQLHTKYEPQIKPLREQLQQAKKQQDTNTINSLKQKLKPIYEAQHQEFKNGLKTILTPDQLQKLDAMKKNHQKNWSNHNNNSPRQSGQ